MNIKKFYGDHAELVGIAHKIERVIATKSPMTEIDPLVEAVQELFGRCSIHLTLEDTTLYPRLAEHSDATVRATAQRFQTEMGGIKAALDSYKRKWPGRIAAARDPSAFVAETEQILVALKDRIARENTVLYPLVERAA